MMRAVRCAVFAAALACAGAAQAKTVIIFVEPMTLERYTQVVETPGPDRFLLCMQPPSLSGCREVQAKKRA